MLSGGDPTGVGYGDTMDRLGSCSETKGGVESTNHQNHSTL